jgi:hypothetical protein
MITDTINILGKFLAHLKILEKGRSLITTPSMFRNIHLGISTSTLKLDLETTGLVFQEYLKQLSPAQHKPLPPSLKACLNMQRL